MCDSSGSVSSGASAGTEAAVPIIESFRLA